MYTLILTVALFHGGVAMTAIPGFEEAECNQAAIKYLAGNKIDNYGVYVTAVCVRGGPDGTTRSIR